MKKLIGLPLFLMFVACSQPGVKTEVFKTLPAPQKAANEVSVMSFNVENLFDTEHDDGKDDFAYLPVSFKSSPAIQAQAKQACDQNKNPHYRRECHDNDWTTEVLSKKMKGVSDVLLQVDQGQGADILVLVEVENEKVLKNLNQNFLQPAKYQTLVLKEGADPRGIDVAVLSRFPQVGAAVLHPIPFKVAPDKEKTMRGILEVTLKLPDQSLLTVLAGHFPSQANPREWRAEYVNFVNGLIAAKSKKNPVIAAGDFNITAEEEAQSRFFTQTFAQNALVSHQIGCQDCPGTHNYKGSWSFLDVMLFSKDLGPTGKANWKVIPESITLPRSQSVHLQSDGRPERFEIETGKGVSDHFPVYARLAPRLESQQPRKVK